MNQIKKMGVAIGKLQKQVAALEAKVFSSNAVLAVTSDSRFHDKESEVAIAFAKWIKRNKNKIDWGRAWSSIYYDFTKANDR